MLNCYIPCYEAFSRLVVYMQCWQKKRKEPGWADKTVDDNMSYVHSLRLKFLGQTLRQCSQSKFPTACLISPLGPVFSQIQLIQLNLIILEEEGGGGEWKEKIYNWYLHSSEYPAMPLRDVEQPVKRRVPFPLSTMPGSTLIIYRVGEWRWRCKKSTVSEYKKRYLLSAVKGTDRRNGKGFVEGIDAKVLEGGGVRR